jgi:hypothetical protein
MSGWREMLLDVIKLTDTVATMNRDIEKLDNILRDVDKRVVRLETALEFSNRLSSSNIIESAIT